MLKQTGEDFLLKLSEYDKEMERLMQKTEHGGDLEALNYQVISSCRLPLLLQEKSLKLSTVDVDDSLVDVSYTVIFTQKLHEIWNSVSHESAMRRNCVQEFDELLVKYELERAEAVIY